MVKMVGPLRRLLLVVRLIRRVDVMAGWMLVDGLLGRSVVLVGPWRWCWYCPYLAVGFAYGVDFLRLVGSCRFPG
jgi:hypothetical protein